MDKGLIFLSITDGIKDIQLTLKEGEYKIKGELKVGASISSEGTLSKTPKGFDEFVVTHSGFGMGVDRL